MRLLVLGPGHPFRGGIASTTTALVRALRDRGHDVLFFAALSQYPRWLYPGGDDRDPAACPPLPGTRRCLDPFAPWSWRAARALALAAAAGAWVVPYWTWAWAGWWSFLLQGHLRPPAVAVVHNPADHQARTLQRLAARMVLCRCQGLFTHAQALAETLRRDYPWVPVSAHPLASAVSSPKPAREAARETLGLAPGRRVALFLGLIRPYKGVDLLVEAMTRLPADSDWQLVVAGEPWGGLGDELSRRVADAELGERVRLLLGWVPEERVATLLAAADVVVLPYRSGSQSAVAPLALGHGVPVVSTEVGGLPEVVAHGRNGLLVPPGSAEALAAALQGLDRETLARLEAGARETAERLTWDAYAEALEGLIDEVVARAG